MGLLRARLHRSMQRAAPPMSSTDALALAQGSTRVQLGVNMPATAVPNDSEVRWVGVHTCTHARAPHNIHSHRHVHTCAHSCAQRQPGALGGRTHAHKHARATALWGLGGGGGVCVGGGERARLACQA